MNRFLLTAIFLTILISSIACAYAISDEKTLELNSNNVLNEGMGFNLSDFCESIQNHIFISDDGPEASGHSIDVKSFDIGIPQLDFPDLGDKSGNYVVDFPEQFPVPGDYPSIGLNWISNSDINI